MKQRAKLGVERPDENHGLGGFEAGERFPSRSRRRLKATSGSAELGRDSHPLVGASAAALATAEYARGDDTAAEHFFERALAAFEKNLDTELDAFAEVTERLAIVRRSGNPARSELELRRALTVVEQRRGRRDQAYLQVASSLASIFSSRLKKSQTSVELAKLGIESRCTPEQACAAKAAGTREVSRPRPALSLAAASDGAHAIERLRPAFKVCVDAARARNRNTNGVVRVALDVDGAGAASSARATSVGLDDLLVSCWLEVALGAKFQPPAGGHAVVVIPLSVEPMP